MLSDNVVQYGGCAKPNGGTGSEVQQTDIQLEGGGPWTARRLIVASRCFLHRALRFITGIRTHAQRCGVRKRYH